MSLVEQVGLVIEDLDAADLRATYKDDPVLWAKNVAGVHLWSGGGGR